MIVLQEHELLQLPHVDVDVGSQSAQTQIVLRLHVASSITKVGITVSPHCGVAIDLSCGWVQVTMPRMLLSDQVGRCFRLIKQNGTHVPQEVEN